MLVALAHPRATTKEDRVLSKGIPMTDFGKTGREVSVVGLGGEGVLRTHGQETAAEAVIHEAIQEGITYFDSAKAYAGSEGYYGRVWSQQPEARNRVFQASKSASRDRRGAQRDLGGTLSRMRIDHLDLWQIHDIRTEEDFLNISGSGGALEAFLEAKETGKTRFIGVTGHHDPHLLARAVREWPVDSVMMPVNPVEGALGGFLDVTLPAARERGIAVIAMKVLGGSHYVFPNEGLSADLLIRFALSYPIQVAIVGCSTPEHVRTLAHTARIFEPMTDQETQQVIGAFRPYARRMAFYRGVF